MTLQPWGSAPALQHAGKWCITGLGAERIHRRLLQAMFPNHTVRWHSVPAISALARCRGKGHHEAQQESHFCVRAASSLIYAITSASSSTDGRSCACGDMLLIPDYLLAIRAVHALGKHNT
jgi:hypothetical protein